MSIRVLVAGQSEAHTRQSNQDRIYPGAGVLPMCVTLPYSFAVADGMGATQDGAEAARLALAPLPTLQTPKRWLEQQELSAFGEQVTGLQERLSALPQDDLALLDQNTLASLLTLYQQAANQEVIHFAGQPGVTGSTLSVLAMTPHHFQLGHVGDSRIYLWRDQTLSQLTTDDNAYGNHIKAGLKPFTPEQLKLTQEDLSYLQDHKLLQVEFFYRPGAQEQLPEEFLDYLSRTLQGTFATQHQLGKVFPVGKSKDQLALALGREATLPSVQTLDQQEGLHCKPLAGDLFLLCTDGLCGVLPSHHIGQRLQQLAQRLPLSHPDLSTLHWGCEMLLEDAINAGSNDNISLLLLQVLDTLDEAPGIEAADSIAPTAIERAKPAFAPPSFTPEIDDTHNDNVPEQLPPQKQDAFYEQPGTYPTTSAPGIEAHTLTPVSGPPRKEHIQSVPSEVHEPGPRAHPTAVLYVIIAALSLALGVSLLWRPHTPPTPSPKAPKPPVKMSSGTFVGLFQVPFPELSQRPDARERLLALAQLNELGARLRWLWQLPSPTQQHIQQALTHEALRAPSIRRILRIAPPSKGDFGPFDSALRQGIVQVLGAMAPRYQRYLDDMEEPLALPQRAMSHNLPKHHLTRLRASWVSHWYNQSKRVAGQKDWRLELLLERVVLHPYKAAHSAPQKERHITKLKACLKHLRHAVEQLKASANHTPLQDLSNRIQLHQAHLKRLQKARHKYAPGRHIKKGRKSKR